MPGKPAISSRNLEAFNRALAEYVKYNKRELGVIIESKSQWIKKEIYKEFRDIAPTADQISSEAEKRGYRTRRRYEGGVRVSFDREIKARRSSIKYLSVSFMLFQWRKKREGQNITVDQRNRRNRQIGKVIDRTARGIRRPSVEIISYLEGALKVNRERAIISRVLAKETLEMKNYVIQKQREAQARTIAKVGEFTKGLGI